MMTHSTLSISLLVCFLHATSICVTPRCTAAESLHERIDEAVNAARVGPAADVCSDSEFVRRIYLDLVGVIPTANEARQFIDDTSPDKRAQLINSLLSDERFAQHMRIVFDAMLIARRAEKHIKNGPWRSYLLSSFRENKPLNALAREILWAGPDDNSPKAAARFYLDREAQPHLVTRDIGRMMLGRDLQCAQCHDHPVIGDYAQSEYYGIYAFINRSYLFTDKKNKQARLAEKGEGDVSYESVFDKGTQYHAGPQLPGRAKIEEPELAKEELYKVKPPKDGPGVPAFSRRWQLAEQMTAGNYALFNRNMANRLWAVMFGRGIVHPLDLHHDDNPPVHPELLNMLASELAVMKFNVRAMLREIALSDTYQRSFQLPDDLAMSKSKAEDALANQKMQRDRHLAAAESARDEVRSTAAKIAEIEKAVAAAPVAIETAEAALKEADQQVDEAAKNLELAREDFDAKTTITEQANEKLAAAQELASEMPGDKELTTMVVELSKTAQEARSALAKSKAAIEQQEVARSKAEKRHAEAQQSLVAAKNGLAATENNVAQIEELRQQRQKARDKAKTAETQTQVALAAIEDVEALLAVVTAENESDATEARDRLLRRSSERFYVYGLQPLSPEQMAMSLYQAVGDLPARLEAARNSEASKVAKQTKNDEEGQKESIDGEIEKRALQAVYNDLQGVMDELVEVFVQTDGQPTRDFEGRANEALYLANSSRVKGLIAGRLTQRLAEIETPDALAEELYLAVFSRRPVAEETKIVTEFLNGRDDDRQLAIGEMVWGLLSSAEFRFNH